MSFICIVCRDLLTNRPETHGPGTVDIIATKCGHVYHLFCLLEYFQHKIKKSPGNESSNYECPYCCATVTQNDVLRIFPSEDEETEELAAKYNEAKANILDTEISQLKSKLDEYRAKHEEEQLAHESLKFDYALKLSEVEQLKRDHETDLSLLDAPQSTWKAMLEKERKSKAKMLKAMTTMEKKYTKQKADLEKELRRKTEDSQKLVAELKAQNESLKKKLERLSTQQQPFRPVFPTAASVPSTSAGPVSMSVISSSSSSSSSQSRRRSANPPQAMIFCPNVTSSAPNQGSSVYGIPNFRPPGGQSHFLNPPNPAQNPYQNLLSAAAAAASSSSNPNQSRNNNGNGNANNPNQSSSSSSSSSSSASNAQGHFQNPGNASGGSGSSGGFNNPNFHAAPFPLPQAHNPNLHAHPPPMHLTMHYPSFYLSSGNSSRNRYPPNPYSFPGNPHIPNSGSSSQISGGEAHAQQADSGNAAAAAARLLPAHVQFYMQTATTAGMTETVGVASSYPSFLTSSMHPPPLSPRH